MTPLSTNNYIYRYSVRSIEDLMPAAFQRRCQKMQNSKADAVFFDLTTASTSAILPALQLLNGRLESPLFKQMNLGAAYLSISPQLAQHQAIELILSEIQLFKRITFVCPIVVLSLNSEQDTKILTNEGSCLEFIYKVILASPLTTTDLNFLTQFSLNFKSDLWHWSFTPYNSQLKNSLTLKDIYRTGFQYKSLVGLEILNSQLPDHYELIGLNQPAWSVDSKNPQIKISVVIPSYNTVVFLSQVLDHLWQQNYPSDRFEVIVVEDGGTDQSCDLLKELWLNRSTDFNLKFIFWPKENPDRGAQTFFRAGLARNLGVSCASGEKIIFLDSDMLVPDDFIKRTETLLDQHDIVQYQRYHIHQKLSQTKPEYGQIQLENDTYIEEKNYWSQLFFCEDWMSLPNYWKFTCTYGLALKKKDFYQVGGFKKYYTSYGFEDTDLGFEFYKKGKSFHLAKIPLLHLTNYDQMQYKNSQLQRLKLLRKTAALFYLQHLKPEIYEAFGNFYRFQKPILNRLKDLF